MNPQNSLYSDGPRNDQIPMGNWKSPYRREADGCRAIRVGMISKCILDMGPGRMGEEDTIFDRKVEIIGGNSEGLWLDEGMQK